MFARLLLVATTFSPPLGPRFPNLSDSALFYISDGSPSNAAKNGAVSPNLEVNQGTAEALVLVCGVTLSRKSKAGRIQKIRCHRLQLSVTVSYRESCAL